MKYYEYGVRTSESGGFVGQFGEQSNRVWGSMVDELTELGLIGWEIYHVIEKNDVIHFLLRRELSSESAKQKYIGELKTRHGFVDHTKPDSDTWQ